MLGARVQQMNGWCAELQFAAACDPAPHMRILPSDPGVAALRKGGDMHTGSMAACLCSAGPPLGSSFCLVMPDQSPTSGPVRCSMLAESQPSQQPRPGL